MSSHVIRAGERGLLFEDGRFVRELEPGRYHVTPDSWWHRLLGKPATTIQIVDTREAELTIKGQEILTADKVAIRVSILVQYRVTDPRAALLEVVSYPDRLYSDVQLAARRALSSMTLEEIMTQRNRLSEEILADVKEKAHGYGVRIDRADVKDLIFPGNLQEVMNRVLAAQRLSEATLVEARTAADRDMIEAETERKRQEQTAQAEANATRLRAEAEAEARRTIARADRDNLEHRLALADALREHPGLLRLEELTALRELSSLANARIYIGFDKHAQGDAPHRE